MQATHSNVIKVAFGDFDQELKQTRKLLAALPEGQLEYQPHAKSYTLGGLAQHVAQLPFLAVSIMRAEELDFTRLPKLEPPRTVEDILNLFDKSAAEARAAFADFTEADLARTWTLRMGERVFFTRPKAALLRDFFISHMVHHRAQLTVYIRLLDAPVPGLYGPSADEV
jgi:uncharacterized damage-inducible protein DinB